jgi:lipopolysaccharide/colanic/teichoic acid biosynthesis glycosyltransferase
MIANSPSLRRVDSRLPTIWGLNPVHLHDRFWAARGVFVVRPNERVALPRDAQIFMLTDSRTLALFPLTRAADRLYWVRPEVLFIRLRRPTTAAAYRELAREDDDGRFLRFERHYSAAPRPTARIALTCDRRVAELWQLTDGSPRMWREFRRQTRQIRRETVAVPGRCYDRESDTDLDEFVIQLVKRWRSPSITIDGAKELRPGVWGDAESTLSSSVRVVGRAWIGVGRSHDVAQERSLVGPAVVWDHPDARPTPATIRWHELEPANAAPAPALIVPPYTTRKSARRNRAQRLFDMAFALLALLITLPLYPLIMLAIWFEDGRPFFFGHRRESIGGREFPCLKFRTMRKDADQIKAKLAANNQSDGPQFFIENDPRVTRIGRFLRKTNLDEIPQFINVLLGHMSVVGPRPSPRNENQCCPAWREARLSVRPGITGLWQVSRTRQAGLDFQEWIRFDVEYVEKASWRLDLLIIFRTFRVLMGV